MLVIQQLLIPPIDKIRAEAPGLIDNLPKGDPSRVLLDRYHRLSTGFFALAIGAALLTLFVTARLLAERRAAPPVPGAARPPVPKILRPRLTRLGGPTPSAVLCRRAADRATEHGRAGHDERERPEPPDAAS